MNRYIALSVIFLALRMTAFSQSIELLASGNKTSLRGLSVVDDNTIWVSGTRGTVARSADGGKSWQWMTVPSMEKRDFRDIEAFDSLHAIIMAVDTPALILKTADGGRSWQKVFEDNTPGMFLDAMDFSDGKNGIVIGDPLQGKFFIASTRDGGNSWTPMPLTKRPAADSGEACFASSGTNIRMNQLQSYFISGGLRSRFFGKGASVDLPLMHGQSSYGANSLAILNSGSARINLYYVVVGGDFAHDTIATGNCAISKDGGKSWFEPAVHPHGYRSCVEFIGAQNMISCGTSGVDISRDSGNSWELISRQGFHACRKALRGNSVFLSGGNGRIAKLAWK